MTFFSDVVETKGAYHVSELAGQTGPSVNGTREF